MKNMMPLLLLAVAMLSCHKDPSGTAPEDISIVTGMFLVDQNGKELGSVGNPNISNDLLAVHPAIPNHNFLAIHPTLVDDEFVVFSDQLIKKLWVVPGIKDVTFSQLDFDAQLKTHQYTEAEIQQVYKQKFEVNDYLYYVSTNAFPKGYYRVICLMEDDLIKWDNIYIENGQDIPTLRDKVLSDW